MINQEEAGTSTLGRVNLDRTVSRDIHCLSTHRVVWSLVQPIFAVLGLNPGFDMPGKCFSSELHPSPDMRSIPTSPSSLRRGLSQLDASQDSLCWLFGLTSLWYFPRSHVCDSVDLFIGCTLLRMPPGCLCLAGLWCNLGSRSTYFFFLSSCVIWVRHCSCHLEAGRLWYAESLPKFGLLKFRVSKEVH